MDINGNDDFIGRIRNTEKFFSTALNAGTCLFMRHRRNTAYLRTRLGRLLSSVMTTFVNKYSAERDSW